MRASMGDGNDTSVPPLGDFGFAGSTEGEGDPVRVLKSDPTDKERVAQSVRFVVNSAADTSAASDTSTTNGRLVLCYVDPGIGLHHYYTYDGAKMDHDKNTFIGDSFAAYKILAADATNKKPQRASDLVNDGDSYAILCSYMYRLRRALETRERVHVVRYSTTDRSCRVTSDPKGDDEMRVAGCDIKYVVEQYANAVTCSASCAREEAKHTERQLQQYLPAWYLPSSQISPYTYIHSFNAWRWLVP
jgi:hypothetical protein